MALHDGLAVTGPTPNRSRCASLADSSRDLEHAPPYIKPDPVAVASLQGRARHATTCSYFSQQRASGPSSDRLLDTPIGPASFLQTVADDE
jgi:hypothetical protein